MEVHRTGYADAGPHRLGDPDLGEHLAHLLEGVGEHDLRAPPDIAGQGPGREHGQPSVRHADGEAGRADRDADEPDVRGQVDERRTTTAAGRRRASLLGEPELVEARDLGRDGRPGHLEAVGELGLRQWPLVTQLDEKA